VDVQKYERQSCREEKEEEADDESVSSRSLLLLQSFCYAIAREKLHGISISIRDNISIFPFFPGFFQINMYTKTHTFIFLNHSLEWC